MPDGFAYDPKIYYIKKGNIEVYVSGHTHRFLTVTGNALNSADVTETEDALQWLLNTYMRRPVPSAAPTGIPRKSYLTDESVIEKASLAKKHKEVPTPLAWRNHRLCLSQ